MSGPWEQYAAPAAPSAAPAPSPTAEAGPWSNYGTAADQKAPPPAAAEPMTLTVTNLKGRKVTFRAPANADDATIRRLAARATGEPRYQRAVVQRQQAETAEGAPVRAGAPEAVTPEADDHSALSGFMAGVMKPVDKAAEWIANTSVGKAVDDFGVSLGFPSVADANAEHDEWRRNNTRTGYQTLGNIAGTIPLARLPGGLAVQGGASGALLTDAHDLKGTARDAAFGAGGSVVGGTALRALGGLASGVTTRGARLLHDAGVPLTLGQIGQAAGNLPGRIVGGVEDFVAGLPGVGAIVNLARDRGVNGFNVAVGNRILGNIGERLPRGTQPGHDMIDAVQRRLSNRYEQLVPNLSANVDMPMATALTAARDLADQASRAPQLERIINNVFGRRLNGQLGQGATISGQMLKDAESELTRLHGRYAGSTGDEALFGDAIDMVRQALRDGVRRSNPDHRAELDALNTGWAQMRAFRGAVRSGTDRAKATGVATPGAVLRQSAGRGYRDPLAEAATDILPNRTPDSGTAGRLLTAGALGGSAYVDPREHPFLSGTLATVGGLSTRQGQVALNRLAFGARPAAVSALSVPLNRLSRYAPQAVTPLLVSPQE